MPLTQRYGDMFSVMHYGEILISMILQLFDIVGSIYSIHVILC